jgi:putative ABC transport system permease protein
MVVFSLAGKNVSRKRERSLLTIAGVLLAVGSFIALLSLAEGLSHRINMEVNSRHVDIYVTPKSAMALPLGPIGTIGVGNDTVPARILDELPKIPNIRQFAGVARMQVRVGNKVTILWGMEPFYFDTFYWYFKVVQGACYSRENEVVLGAGLAQFLKASPGSEIKIANQIMRVSGIGTAKGTLEDYFCYAPLATALKIQKEKNLQEVWVQVEEPGAAAETVLEIEKRFPRLSARTRSDYSAVSNYLLKFAWLLQFAIASIGILISMTAAMNTMLMSTYERIREFGTLRAIGASRLSVAGMILLESVILSLTGGCIGIILGLLGSRVLDDSVRTLLQLSFPIACVTPWLVIQALLLSVVVGVVGGIIPSIIVSRMTVIDSLRWE